MADTEFVLSYDRMHKFIEEKLSDCVIARDGKLAVSGPPDHHLLEHIKPQFLQLFIKHSSFATDDFTFKPHRYADSTEIFLVDQFASSGHAKMLTVPLRDSAGPVFRMTIAYQSFFTFGDAYISPSSELKKFYLSAVKSVKKGTQRIELFPGRSMWFQSELLNSDPGIVEKVRAPFRRK